KPQRAVDLFTDVFSDDKDPRPLLSENERSITDGVRRSVNALIDTRDLGPSLDHTFDVVYNPFPAKLKVVIHGAVLSFEGFDKIDSDTFEATTLSAVEAVAALEGRWISPDPLALAARMPEGKKPAEMAAIIASEPRRAAAVVGQAEVAAALTEKMRPAPRYRLRWV